MLRIFILTFCFATSLHAQDNWDLKRCIEHAQTNSIAVKRTQLAVKNAELTDQVNRLQRMPSVNGRVNGGLQFGRTIDPTTNTFDNITLGFSSASIDIGAPIYTGGQIKHSTAQGKLNLAAAQADAETSLNALALNITLAYLNILLADEEVENATQRLTLSQEQLARVDKLIDAGSLPKNDRLDAEAQIARDEQSRILAQNSRVLNLLRLQQLLELEDTANFQIARPQLNMSIDDLSEFQLDVLYKQALESQPQVHASALRLKSTDYDIKLAEAAKLPVINFFASLNTNYSSVAKRRTSTGDELVLFEGPAFIDGDAVTLGLFQSVPVGGIEDTPVGTQIADNFGQTIGLSINVPIYNKGQNNANIERARLGQLEAQLQHKEIEQQLRQDLQQAITSARASKQSLAAAERSVQAADAAFQNAAKRLEYGAINTLEYTTARNTFDQAQNQLTRAKYQYLFDQKVIDFYLGKPLEME